VSAEKQKGVSQESVLLSSYDPTPFVEGVRVMLPVKGFRRTCSPGVKNATMTPEE
jgi:hypothetical protein